MKISRMDLVAPYLVKESKRDRAYPYVLAAAIAAIIILINIRGVL